MDPSAVRGRRLGEAERVGALATSPGLAVGAVARRLGVAPATLRTWARRYGLGPSGHVAGAHRRYSAQDVARLDLMRRMVNAGVSPGDAARAARSATAEMLTDEPAADSDRGSGMRRRGVEGADVASIGTPRPSPGTAGSRPVAQVPAWMDRTGGLGGAGGVGGSGGPGGTVLALPGGVPAARTLARAALELDAATCIDVITERIEQRGVSWTWDQLLVPVLTGIGNRWATTGAGIEVEHLVADAAITAMRIAAFRHRHFVNARPVLLACADEEEHSLPLFVLAAALAERHVEARMLGARVPPRALVVAIRRLGPAAVLLWSATPETGDVAALHRLPTLRPAPLLLLGGPGWAGELPPSVTKVHDLADAIARITAVVG